ncbi:hypothetical protein [Mucisphaera calidilacus]|uniref:Uncharacterized protein n=1 Tax=Mucisphaera calidilacus TaxID=2527982 RepID=A0A518BXU5_9BACT|nr:hypothetical protein [Mucisphaera calidilacus]QDU71790.1 hypothetical protein Pan265_16430 [Mucisphaera calidilacus]
MAYRVRLEHVSWVEAMPLLRLARAWSVGLRLEAWGLAYLGLLFHLGVTALLGWSGDGWASVEGDRGVLPVLGHLLWPAALFGGQWPLWLAWCVELGLLKTLVGGTLSRMASQRWSRIEEQGVSVAMAVVLRRFGWYLLTPVLPMLVGVLLLVPLVLAGLLLRVPVAEWLGLVLTVVGLPMAMVATVVLLGLVLAGPLLPAALGAEGTDGFDALSRIYAFTVARPMSWAGSLVLLTVFGVLGYAVLVLFVMAGVCGAQWLLSAVSGVPMAFLWQGYAGSDAAEGVWWLVLLAVVLLPAGLISYVYAGIAWIYLSLRQLYDGTPVYEVALTTGPGSSPSPTKDVSGG